jgi:hypothetical protein
MYIITQMLFCYASKGCSGGSSSSSNSVGGSNSDISNGVMMGFYHPAVMVLVIVG